VDGETGGVRSDLVAPARRILSVLDAANTPQALNLPGLRLHALKGDRKGFWAVTVRAKRILAAAAPPEMSMKLKLADRLSV
jgi:proteic killer suppression protein